MLKSLSLVSFHISDFVSWLSMLGYVHSPIQWVACTKLFSTPQTQRRRNHLHLQLGYVCVFTVVHCMSLYQCSAHSLTMESTLSPHCGTVMSLFLLFGCRKSDKRMRYAFKLFLVLWDNDIELECGITCLQHCSSLEGSRS